MNEKISHRGPDGEGIFVRNSIGLGHRRLAIIDLSPAGAQPMSDWGEKIWITFNGEIYNFQELRQELTEVGVKFKSRTDTEVIIYLYKKYGFDCLKKLRGMFAFAIWDEEKQLLFLARDKVGKKPLKYYLNNQVFIFASELKAILTQPEVNKEIDLTAIDDFLTYQYVPSPKTGFKNIFKLPPASYMVVEKTGKIKIEKYWNLNFEPKLKLTANELETMVLEKLKESIKLRMIADVPLGAHLSGGVDSSLVVSLMALESTQKVKTFSIGFREGGFNELAYAKLVAQKYQTEHTEFLVRPDAIEILPQLIYHYEEPYGDSSALPTWYLSRETKKHVTVALNGDGGDENFGGYDRYNAARLHNLLELLPFKKAILKQLSQAPSQKQILRIVKKILAAYHQDFNLYYLNLVSYFTTEEKLQLLSPQYQDRESVLQRQSFLTSHLSSLNSNTIDKIIKADFNTYLPNDLLVKVDVASMAHGLEVRSPFLDTELLELSATIPSHLKIKFFNKKYLLKKIAYNFLPRECIDRPKKGFAVPLADWFRDELHEYAREKIVTDSMAGIGFNIQELEKIIRDHKIGRANNAHKIWLLLTLSEWLQTFFKNA